MKRAWTATVIVVALFVASSAFAQSRDPIEDLIASRVGTTSMSAYPQFADGKLNSCIFEFNAIARDNQYRRGGFMKVFGSFGLMSAGGSMAVILKLVVHDIDQKTMAFNPSAPANSYFVFGTKTSRDQLVTKYASDTPGAQFSIFRLSPTFEMLAEEIDKQKVTLAFNRSDGGQDVMIPLDLRVKDTNDQGRKSYSEQTVLDFYSCAKDLIDISTPASKAGSRK